MKAVIEMAHETLERMNADEHYREQYWSATDDELQAFAELVRADEREQGQKWFDAVTAQHKQAILAEREACANLVFHSPPSDEYECPLVAVYKAIRARSNT